MGTGMARDLASVAMRDWLREEVALAAHLRGNFYPPLPIELLPACRATLAALREDDPDRRIDMPRGVLWRGRSWCTAGEMAESARLWDLV